MWPWQHNHKLPKKVQFWGKLLSLSLLLHSLVLCLIFFVYKGSYFAHTVAVDMSMLRSGAKVVYCPFQKTTKRVHKKKTRNIASHKNLAVKKTKKKSPPPKKKVVIKKKKPKTALASKSKPVVKKKPAKKNVTKKKTQTAVKKSTDVKTMADKLVEKKPLKVVEKKVPKVKPKKIEKNKPVKVAQKESVEQGEQDIIYVGRIDKDILKMHEVIQQELQTVWQPPAGLSKELQCQLKVLVAWDGTVKDVAVEKTSGVVMYDVAARSSLASVPFDKCKWARGKEFSITFKQ